MQDFTRLLNGVSPDAPAKGEELLPLVYVELRRLATVRMAQEKPGQTLQATALVHEAWLHLLGSGRPEWEGRGRFFAGAAEVTRRILVENATRAEASPLRPFPKMVPMH